MNRAVSGTLSVLETGRPLVGLQVVAARLLGDEVEVLGTGFSGRLGRFRVQYDPVWEPADLTLFVFTPCGRLVFQEPVHRAIGGAELQLQVEVPRRLITADLH